MHKNCELFKTVPRNIGTKKLLVQLLGIIDNHLMCEGCRKEKNYRVLLNDLGPGESVYKTKDGRDAVFIENEKIISTKCHLFLTKEDATQCDACKKAHHYLRTLISRKSTEKNAQNPEKGRLYYKSKPELLQIARQ